MKSLKSVCVCVFFFHDCMRSVSGFTAGLNALQTSALVLKDFAGMTECIMVHISVLTRPVNVLT